MSFLNSRVPVKWEQELHESWWKLTGYYRARSENSSTLIKIDEIWWECMRVDGQTRARVVTLINSHALSSTSSCMFKFWWVFSVFARFADDISYLIRQLSSIIMQLLFSFDQRGMRGEKNPSQTLAYQLSSPFDWGLSNNTPKTTSLKISWSI
jgi:hypothetical protein